MHLLRTGTEALRRLGVLSDKSRLASLDKLENHAALVLSTILQGSATPITPGICPTWCGRALAFRFVGVLSGIGASWGTTEIWVLDKAMARLETSPQRLKPQPLKPQPTSQPSSVPWRRPAEFMSPTATPACFRSVVFALSRIFKQAEGNNNPNFATSEPKLFCSPRKTLPRQLQTVEAKLDLAKARGLWRWVAWSLFCALDVLNNSHESTILSEIRTQKPTANADFVGFRSRLLGLVWSGRTDCYDLLADPWSTVMIMAWQRPRQKTPELLPSGPKTSSRISECGD
ncbi:hypothetical protein B0T26DRAFT_75437 [Lasiosphaeria miniovina]|uniref:Uncharacterized protein n=1 Tax=Lasiosphaeria miniovina TaxID=1954250 RepID=A0AA40BHW9_9PEZI|nr:uncharacterized protein B0T26DRAFT_75437 [Lasiosphaeria miniovina]KAK0734551.1 hypothetical protein B0T26DRAFT_75437 [Lasiosphaeria miniovina]